MNSMSLSTNLRFTFLGPRIKIPTNSSLLIRGTHSLQFKLSRSCLSESLSFISDFISSRNSGSLAKRNSLDNSPSKLISSLLIC